MRRRRLWAPAILFAFAIFTGYYFTLNFIDQLLPSTIISTTTLSILSDRKNQRSIEDAKWVKSRVTNDSSPLGNWLLSQEDSSPPAKSLNKSTPFIILVWEHGPFLERRHLRRFSRNKKFSPWESCSVSNCQLTYDSKKLDVADAVIFHLHRISSATTLPRRSNYQQRWIFLTDESPLHTFLFRSQNISDYDGLFNWSMTYRMNSDVPVPYGRTILESNNEIPNDYTSQERRYEGLVAILASNCFGENNRWSYVRELKNILGNELQILGGCLMGNRSACPGHFDADCPLLDRYKFYLSFENSNCREYLSEKIFWNAYSKYSVPVIMGAPRSDCERLLPPNSYLHVDDFANPASLANYLKYLDRNDREYRSLHDWRSKGYKVINEHGYFGSRSMHYCRVCEALNYNPTVSKVYEDMHEFWNADRDCTRK